MSDENDYPEGVFLRLVLPDESVVLIPGPIIRRFRNLAHLIEDWDFTTKPELTLSFLSMDGMETLPFLVRLVGEPDEELRRTMVQSLKLGEWPGLINIINYTDVHSPWNDLTAAVPDAFPAKYTDEVRAILEIINRICQFPSGPDVAAPEDLLKDLGDKGSIHKLNIAICEHMQKDLEVMLDKMVKESGKDTFDAELIRKMSAAVEEAMGFDNSNNPDRLTKDEQKEQLIYLAGLEMSTT